MRERVRDKGRLEHILYVIDALMEGRSKYSLDEITNDPIIFHGFVKHVEIIGETVYKLTKEFKESHPNVEWQTIERMRHVLVHGYYNIKPPQLWDTINDDIPKLKPFIENFLLELKNQE